MNEKLPILYTFRRCPYAMRARAVLHLTGITCEMREVKLSNKPKEMLEISPKGTVPVLVLPNGQVIDESLDIMHWAMSQNPSVQLLPEDASLRNQMEKLIVENDTAFKKNLDRYKYPQKFSDASSIMAREQCVLFLHQLEDRLTSSKHLFGSGISCGDLAILPFVRQFAKVDERFFNSLDTHAVKKWLADWIASPLFESIMRKNSCQ